MDKAVVIWQGKTSPVEFSYKNFDGEKSRRKVDVHQVLYDPEKDSWYLRGHCHEKNAERTFKTRNITTMLKIGSKRFSVFEWLEDFLEINTREYQQNHWEDEDIDEVTVDKSSTRPVTDSESFRDKIEKFNAMQEQKLKHLKETKPWTPAQKLTLKILGIIILVSTILILMALYG